MSQIVTSPVAPPRRPPVAAPVLAARLAVGAAVAWTLVAVVTTVVALALRGEMQDYVEWTGEEARGFTIIMLLGLVEVALMVAAWIAGSVWLLGLRRVAQAVAPDYAHRRSEVWAVLGWVVPVVSFWFPLQVVSDAMSALRRPAHRRVVTLWWAAWLVCLVGGNAATRMGGDLMTADDVASWVLGVVIATLLQLLALPTWVAVVRRATREAQEASAVR